MSTTTLPVERQGYSVEEVAASFGLAPATVRQAIRRGELPCIRIGRRLVVPRPALDRLLAGEAVKDLSTLPSTGRP